MGLDDRMRDAMRVDDDGRERGDVGAVRRRARARVLRRRGAFGAAVMIAVVAIGATALATRDDGGSHPPAAVAQLPVDAQLAMSKVPRATPDSTDVAKLVAANSQFAFDLYHQLAKANTNLFFSPSSISTALALAYAGARGTTASEMANTLHFDKVPGNELHAAFNALAQELLAPRTSADKGRKPLQLELSNSAWGQRGYTFLRGYLDTLARYYGAGMHLSDFERHAEAERVRINSYVAQQTKGRIKELLPPGIIDGMTRLVLVNTITFTAQWRVPFNHALTELRPFTRLDGTTVSVPMMHRDEARDVPAMQGDGYLAARLPYAGGASMLLIVPDAGHFGAVSAAVGPAMISSIDSRLTSGWTEVWMPRFDLEWKQSLNETLQTLGTRAAFGNADFSGMDGTHNLFISGVMHDAKVHVDEDGTKAAAATAAVMELDAKLSGITVDANRPFIYLIRDDATGAILFAGQVLDPPVTSVG